MVCLGGFSWRRSGNRKREFHLYSLRPFDGVHRLRFIFRLYYKRLRLTNVSMQTIFPVRGPVYRPHVLGKWWKKLRFFAQDTITCAAITSNDIRFMMPFLKLYFWPRGRFSAKTYRSKTTTLNRSHRGNKTILS